MELAQPRVVRSINGLLELVLTISICRFKSDALSFNSRAYNCSYPGPTLIVQPGDKIVIHLHNHLDIDYDTMKNLVNG